MIRLIFAIFLLLLSGVTGTTILIFAVNPASTKGRAEPKFGILWTLFILCGASGLMLLGIIPLLPK
jgi:hypothetical protein